MGGGREQPQRAGRKPAPSRPPAAPSSVGAAVREHLRRPREGARGVHTATSADLWASPVTAGRGCALGPRTLCHTEFIFQLCHLQATSEAVT